MHKCLLPSLLAALAAFSTLAAKDAAPPSLRPKPPVKAAPATPPADAIVRAPDAPQTPPPPAASEPPAAPVNLLTTVETWALSQDDFVAILDGSANESAPYDRLEALAKAGKAKLTGLIAVSTKTGQHAIAESIDEVLYPTEFDPAERAHDIAFPTSNEVRNVGDTLELEPVIGSDGKTIDVKVVTQSIRFDGFRDWQPEPNVQPIGQPQFRNEKVTTNTTVISGRPAFLATATPAEAAQQGEKQIRARVLRVTAQPAQLSAPVVGGPIDARVEMLVYSLDREAARRILNATAESAESYAAVRELVAKGEAQLETVSAFVTKSGQRGVNEEITEFHHLGHINPPSYPSREAPAESRAPATPSTFESRHLGVTLEIEPVFGPDARSVDLSVVPQIVQMPGMLKRDGVAAKYPPRPVFTVRKVTTSVGTGTGVPVLVGTMNQPRDNGVNDRKDDGRTSLVYIRVTAVRP